MSAKARGRACPACATVGGSLIHHLDLRTPDAHPLQGGYDVVACQVCGAGYADAVIRPEYYDHYYGELAKYADDTALVSNGVGSDARVDPWRGRRLDATADRIVSLIGGGGGRLLDIGCGDGTLLSALQARGMSDVRGVDPSARSSTTAAQHGVRVDVGTFSRMPAGLGRFDVVCLTGVLEHVWEIDQAMGAALSHLLPDGFLYLELPDASRYLDPYIGPFEDFNSEHVNHFSPATLVTLGRRFGLAAMWSGPTDTELAPGVSVACTGVALRRNSAQPLEHTVTMDTKLVSVLEQFAARSRQDLASIDRRLRQQLGDCPDFVLWGMGELSMKLLASTVLADAHSVALVDGNVARQGIRYLGQPVIPPEAVPRGSTPIVVGSLVRTGPITAAINDLDIPNPVVTVGPQPVRE